MTTKNNQTDSSATSGEAKCQYPNCGCTSRATCNFNYDRAPAPSREAYGVLIELCDQLEGLRRRLRHTPGTGQNHSYLLYEDVAECVAEARAALAQQVAEQATPSAEVDAEGLPPLPESQGVAMIDGQEVDAYTAEKYRQGQRNAIAFDRARRAGSTTGDAVPLPDDALNTMLWLYRRLPRAYGRPPQVEQSIMTLAKQACTEVGEFLAERDDKPAAAPQSPAGAA